MQIRIKPFEYEGAKYISVDTIRDTKWIEKSFEYTDNDSLKKILSLLEVNINNII